jgi:DNA-binding transcriptional regulator GbsR (MarR family)
MAQNTNHFADDLTRGYIQSGLPRSVAELLVFLTICEPAEQTAAGLREQLDLSTGSISTALNMLVAAGLVSRTKLARSKHYTYELKSEAWEHSIMQRIAAIEQLAAVASRGVKLMPNNPRLSSMYDMYEYFGAEFKNLMSRYRSR